MCNPRRVMVHLSETIEEAWRTTVEQVARREGQVEEVVQMTADIGLDAEMGDRALQMFERILQGEIEGYDAWAEDEAGAYRHEMGEVTLVYQPGSHQLLIEARLSEMISAEARATAEASGFTMGDVSVEAVGGYYDDGWGGHTEARARRQAQANAQQQLTDAIDALHRTQNAAELSRAEAQARARAEEEAAQRLQRRHEDVRAALRTQLQATLANAEERVYYTMNRLVGEAYRQTLLQLVRENGGRVLANEQTGSVINLELEFF